MSKVTIILSDSGEGNKVNVDINCDPPPVEGAPETPAERAAGDMLDFLVSRSTKVTVEDAPAPPTPPETK